MNLYKIHPDPLNAPYRDWAFEHAPWVVWDEYRGQPEELKKREAALARDTWLSYQYAFQYLKGPFPLGEDAIAEDAHSAYHYAKYCLKGPFPAGEQTIARNPFYSVFYVRDVLKLTEADVQSWMGKVSA